MENYGDHWVLNTGADKRGNCIIIIIAKISSLITQTLGLDDLAHYLEKLCWVWCNVEDTDMNDSLFKAYWRLFIIIFKDYWLMMSFYEIQPVPCLYFNLFFALLVSWIKSKPSWKETGSPIWIRFCGLVCWGLRPCVPAESS